MAQSPILHASTREVMGKKVKLLRAEGSIPAVVYGHGTTNQNITIREGEFQHIFNQGGTSTLVDLIIDNNQPVKVLMHEPQLHATKTSPLHADFYVVKMTEKLQTEIPVHFIGESEAVTVLDGTLNTPLDTLNVECFPDKLVPAIEVDLSVLKTLEDIIRIGDIKLPEGIEVLDDPEEVIATITPPRSEEELAALEEAPTGEEADKAAVEGVEVTEEKPAATEESE